MKFSIVITTYNRLDLLKRAINSALKQTVECEIIVVDDCSIDGTKNYVNSLEGRVMYYCTSSNQGHAATMNLGVQNAQGDWIKPLDDDDYIAANCIEEMTKAITLHSQAVILSCQAAQVDFHQVEISRTYKTGPGTAFYIPQEDIHYGMLLELLPFGTPIQVAFRRDAFLESGGWDTNLRSCDDIDSWIRISEFGDAIFLNQCLVYRTIWIGGYDRKIPLKQRCNTNILMKEKIYTKVHKKYSNIIPDIKDVRQYINLHWGIVAAKQKQLLTAINMLLPAVFYLKAWQLFLAVTIARKLKKDNKKLSKKVLIN
ncbi:MAG: glycosyltransferase family 2 protein [Okeania sp. SIO3B5]|uniref:glycosyltransferase family 2 protein n=1 Tax=Okeania sp. SIO3B5 TaxID=2607811 RepID=UPI0013FFCEAE|nr:glycosyltransferase family 2 protein [Okeania sp. SIO3B5]NEO57611.1 glycosyltransferase family 2 protein [Okeania sp. SIO3B5]